LENFRFFHDQRRFPRKRQKFSSCDIEYFAYVNNQRQRGELTKGNHQVIDIAQLWGFSILLIPLNLEAISAPSQFSFL
jgi:hypothetical protein